MVVIGSILPGKGDGGVQVLLVDIYLFFIKIFVIIIIENETEKK